MEAKGNYRIVSTNKRERTITIRHDYTDGSTPTFYKSCKLNKEDFNYYRNYATENDIKQFLKGDDYYILRK